MKYTAQVTQIMHRINMLGGLADGEVRPVADMPLPDRVEIVPEVPEESDGSYMMFRYTHSGEFCGDTWHETLKEAFDQAAYEYGLRETDFLRIE